MIEVIFIHHQYLGNRITFHQGTENKQLETQFSPPPFWGRS